MVGCTRKSPIAITNYNIAFNISSETHVIDDPLTKSINQSATWKPRIKPEESLLTIINEMLDMPLSFASAI